jgi:hypothetical protein
VRQGILLIALAGCGAHNPGTCDQKHPCDDGFVCDFTDPAGPSCIDADGDLDGDGIANRDDHCPRGPGGLYDEDGDGLGDDCDPCPIAPPPAVPDDDGDDVDSPCDPDPHTPGDKIAAFSGFQTLPDNWTQRTPGAWVVMGGEVVVTPPTTATETLTIPLSVPSNKLAILTAYRIDQVDGGTEHDVDVTAADPRPAGGTTLLCGGQRTLNGDSLQLVTTEGGGSKPLTDLFNTASLYEVVAKAENASAACAVVADHDMGAVSATISGDTLTQAGLSVHGATARFGYVLVISRPPN